MAVDKNLRASLSPEQKAEFTDVFNSIDADGSGAISTEEVKSGLALCGMRPTDEEVADLIARFDVNGDGELELFEWLEMSAVVFLGKDEQELQDDVFKLIADKDSGAITVASLTTCWKRVMRDSSFSEEDAERMLAGMGISLKEDKTISRTEFNALLEAAEVTITMPK